MNDFDVYEADGVRVEWVELGEGYSGDYNPDDPDDVELLRFDVYVAADPKVEEYWDNDGGFIDEATGQAWAGVRDGSYCTSVPVSTSPEDRQSLLQQIHIHIGNPPGKLAMEAASWISLGDLTQA